MSDSAYVIQDRDLELALQYDARLREIERADKATFTELGEIAVKVTKRELWRKLKRADGSPYASRDAWVHNALPTSNGRFYDALRCAECLSYVPLETREQIPWGNQKILAKVPKGQVGPPILELAQTLPVKEFEQRMKDAFPLSHIQLSGKMVFKTNEDERADIEQAIKFIMETEDCSRDECLHFMAIATLQDFQRKADEYDYAEDDRNYDISKGN